MLSLPKHLDLPQRLFSTPLAERRALTDAIVQSSPVSGQCIDTQGKFDFSAEALSEALHFDLAELVGFEWEAAPRPASN